MPRFLDEHINLAGVDTAVILRRSAKRRRTISAFWEDGKAVIAIPATLSTAEGTEWAVKMLPRLTKRRGPAVPGDAELAERAAQLSQRYLTSRAVPTSVRWVTNQRGRWGSTTPAHGTIRLSHALQGMPDWVVDYVLLHELAHLLVAGHGPQFWAHLRSYPHTETAKAFLSGVTFATTRGVDLGDAADFANAAENPDAD